MTAEAELHGSLAERQSAESSPAGSARAPRECGEPALSELEFYGCYSRPMTLAEYEEYEGKVEFFDSAEEIAWIAKVQNDPVKEAILERFTELMEGVAQARGAPIALGGGLVVGARSRQRKLPEGDPLLRAQIAEDRAEFVRVLLASRGIAVPPSFPSPRETDLVGSATAVEIVAAADAAESVADFFSRLADPGS